jgi:hypothetical protein
VNLSPHFSHSGWQQILGGPFKPLFGLSGVAALSLPATNLHVRKKFTLCHLDRSGEICGSLHPQHTFQVVCVRRVQQTGSGPSRRVRNAGKRAECCQRCLAQSAVVSRPKRQDSAIVACMTRLQRVSLQSIGPTISPSAGMRDSSF